MRRNLTVGMALVSMLLVCITADRSPAANVPGSGPTAAERLQPFDLTIALQLLHRQAIFNDLNLSDAEYDALNALNDDFHTQLTTLPPTMMHDNKDLISKRQAGMAKIDADIGQKLVAILGEKRTARLRQLGLQYFGTMVVLSPPIAASLKITEAQKQKLIALAKELVEAGKKIGQKFLPDTDRKTVSVRKEYDQKMLALLMPEQRDRFEAMEGKKVEFPRLPATPFEIVFDPEDTLRIGVPRPGPQVGRLHFYSLGNESDLPRLLRLDSVAKDLNLSDAQKSVVNRAVAKLRQRLGRERTRPQTTFEERMEWLHGANYEFEETVGAVLSDQQVARLRQLALQFRGPSILGVNEIAAALKLTDDQKKSLGRLIGERFSAAVRLRKSGEDPTARTAKRAKAEQDFNDNMVAVLTPEQRTQFEKMQGKKIDLHIRRPSATPNSGEPRSSAAEKPDAK